MAEITSVELGAVGRYIDLGSPAALDDLAAYTCLSYCRPSSGGENSFGYLYGKTPASSLNGPRFFIGSQLYFTFGAHSATAGAPSRASANTIVTLNTWQHIASTWDGTLTAANIKHYFGAGVDLAEVAAYGATTNGTTAISSDAANNAFLLNRAGLGRAFVGDVAYIALWNRVLTPAELVTAQNSGPLDVPNGLVLLWANQQDLSPSAIAPAGRSAFVAGTLPPNVNLGGSAAVALAGDAAANASATGDLTSGSGMAGAAAATAAASGTLDHGVPLDGAAAAQAFASGNMEAVVTILSPAERGTLELANCSVTPNGLTPTITLKNRWIAGENAIAARMMYGKVSGVLGMTPSFRLSRTDFEGTIQTGKKFAYSYDKVTWYEMANRANDASYFYFSHNAAFTGNDVYFASQVPWLIEHTLPWIQSLEASGYVSEAPSSAGAGYVFATRSATQNELSEAIAAIPLYSFKISSGAGNAPDGLPKRPMMLSAGTHASEDIGNYVLRGAVEFLTSGDAQALTLLSWFNVFVYPMVSSAGRQGGGTRNDFQTGFITADTNRNWHNANIETLVAHKAAIAVDCGSVVPVVIDFHGHQNSASTYNYVQNGSDSATWQAAILAYRAAQTFQSWNTVGTCNYWAQSALSPDINITPEYPFYWPTTMPDTLDYGADHMRAVSDIAASGYWANINGSAIAQAAASGSLSVSIPLAGAGLAASTATGALSVQLASSLAGAATATANAQGGLSIAIPLAGSAVAQALAAAGLEVGKPLAGSATTENGLTRAIPVATVYSDPDWITAAPSLHEALDDLADDDGQYIETSSIGETYVEVKLSAIPDPAISTGHRIRYTASAPDGAQIAVQLFCGANMVRNLLNFVVPVTPTSYSVLLTNAQADLITDYADLRIRIVTLGGATVHIHRAGLEVIQSGVGATGGLTVNVSLAGAAIAGAAAAAGLTVTSGQGLAGNAQAQASASGSLTLGVPLTGAALTASNANGNLTQIIPLEEAAASASMATGGLDVRVNLSASALAQAVAAAGLNVQQSEISGDATSQAGALGTLTLRVNLSGDAIAQAVASGFLAGTGVLSGTRGYRVTRTPRTWRVS